MACFHEENLVQQVQVLLELAVCLDLVQKDRPSNLLAPDQLLYQGDIDEFHY